MKRQSRRDTRPELMLRRAVHERGLRYYVDRPVLAGLRRRADMVFPRARVAVFVDGCFWHCCPQHATVPRRNREWWGAKLAGNVARDRDTNERLGAAGWKVIRVWEHEAGAAAAANRVEEAVRSRLGSADAATSPGSRPTNASRGGLTS